MSRLLVVCGEPIGERMAGPAIRALELGRAAAAAGNQVTIAAPVGHGRPLLPAGVSLVPLDSSSLGVLLEGHECVLAGASLLSRFPGLARTRLPLALDLYVPVVLEAARLFAGAPQRVQRAVISEAAAVSALELRRADLVLCANQRQRDLWLGVAASCGRLAADPGLARDGGLIRVVPFGVPDEAPVPGAAPRLRGVVPGIGAADRVMLWAGGLHDWFDPGLVIEALDLLERRDGIKDLRLVFLGSTPPNTRLAGHGSGRDARELARERGLLDRSVFFLDGWVPYAERGAYLAEADIGVSAHLEGLETYFSWRTRLLDYAWAGLPLAGTGGDSLSALLEERGMALLCAPGDAPGLAARIRELLEPEAGARARAAAAEVAVELRWSRVAQPFVDWVNQPLRTAGRAGTLRARAALWRMLAAKSAHVLATEGPAAVVRRSRRFRGPGRRPG